MTTEQKVIKGFALFLAFIIIMSIVSAILGGISMMWAFDDDGKYIKEEETEITDYAGVTKLDIDLGSISLEVMTGEKFKVEKYDLKNDVTIKREGSTLKISEKDYFWPINTKVGKIVLTIPRKVELKDLSIDIGAGKVTMDDIRADKLDFDQGAGTVNMNNCTFQNVDIDGGAGKMTIENANFTDLDLDCGVGSIDLAGKVMGKSKIEAGVGSLNLKLSGSLEDYTLYVEKGIGSIKVDGNSTSGRIGDGPNKIDIEGGVGSINVNFR